MRKDSLKEQILRANIAMINMIGLRHDAGQDWAWVYGMLKHHLTTLVQRTVEPLDFAIVVEELTISAQKVIGHFVNCSGPETATTNALTRWCDLVDVDYEHPYPEEV